MNHPVSSSEKPSNKLEPLVQSAKVLIVDDEHSICKVIEGVLKDEGLASIFAHNAESALALLESEDVALVLLDIWLPGMDGLQCLEQIKLRFPNVAVIMISGHATISSAVKATQRGALDFIEKPFDLNIMLEKVKSALKGELVGTVNFNKNSTEHQSVHSDIQTRISINSEPFLRASASATKGEQVRHQSTLKHNALLYGQGLHSGQKSGLSLEPLPAGSGIHFAAVSESIAVPAFVSYVESTGYATTIRLGGTQAGTIEHLMSALHAYGISNLLIKCNGEVPVLDGSAQEFCKLIEDTGIEMQDSELQEIVVTAPIEIRGPDAKYISIEPADSFIVEYTLNYPEPLGKQVFSFELSDPLSYKQEISQARTFGFVKDIDWLQKQGLALGGRFDNFVLFGEGGPINTSLRYPNEPVRHKILDLIGDLYLLGRPIKGRVRAEMTGHGDNIKLLTEIAKQVGLL